MKFPSWAPNDIVEKYQQMVFDNEVHTVSQLPGMNRDSSEQLRVLERLLTYPRMESVWRAIKTRPDADLTRYFFVNVILGCKEEYLNEDKRPKGKRLASLNKVAKKVDALLMEIKREQVAKDLAEGTMMYALVAKNFGMRIGRGEVITDIESEYPEWPTAHACDEWPETEWKTWKAENKLKYWVESAEELNLIELLQFFLGQLEHAGTPPLYPIKEGAGGFKAFLIRRLSRYMSHNYGSPLDEVVAATVATVLNLSFPLDRDDIRPYLDRNGKE